jgi:hypothetical protein
MGMLAFGLASISLMVWGIFKAMGDESDAECRRVKKES